MPSWGCLHHETEWRRIIPCHWGGPCSCRPRQQGGSEAHHHYPQPLLMLAWLYDNDPMVPALADCHALLKANTAPALRQAGGPHLPAQLVLVVVGVGGLRSSAQSCTLLRAEVLLQGQEAEERPLSNPWQQLAVLG